MGDSGNPAKRAEQAAAKQRPATFDRLMSKKGVTRKIPVYLDADTQEEYVAAEGAYLNSLTNSDMDEDDRAELKTAWEAAKEALEETTDWLTLKRPVVTVPVNDDEPDGPKHELRGRRAYEWLTEHHPPTDEQNVESQKEHGVDAPYNADTFAPALISACCVEPQLTPDQVAALIEEWSLTEVFTLFTTAMEVSNSNQVGSLGKGSGRMSGS